MPLSGKLRFSKKLRNLRKGPWKCLKFHERYCDCERVGLDGGCQDPNLHDCGCDPGEKCSVDCSGEYQHLMNGGAEKSLVIVILAFINIPIWSYVWSILGNFR